MDTWEVKWWAEMTRTMVTSELLLDYHPTPLEGVVFVIFPNHCMTQFISSLNHNPSQDRT